MWLSIYIHIHIYRERCHICVYTYISVYTTAKYAYEIVPQGNLLRNHMQKMHTFYNTDAPESRILLHG